MSAELWLEALGEIDGAYIEEVLSERPTVHRRRVRRGFLAAAACLVIVLSMAIPSALRQRTENPPEDGPAAFTEPEAPQKPPAAEGENAPSQDNGQGTEERPTGETTPADDPAPPERETGYTGPYYGAGAGLTEAYSTLIFRDVQTELKLPGLLPGDGVRSLPVWSYQKTMDAEASLEQCETVLEHLEGRVDLLPERTVTQTDAALTVTLHYWEPGESKEGYRYHNASLHVPLISGAPAGAPKMSVSYQCKGISEHRADTEFMEKLMGSDPVMTAMLEYAQITDPELTYVCDYDFLGQQLAHYEIVQARGKTEEGAEEILAQTVALEVYGEDDSCVVSCLRRDALVQEDRYELIPYGTVEEAFCRQYKVSRQDIVTAGFSYDYVPETGLYGPAYTFVIRGNNTLYSRPGVDTADWEDYDVITVPAFLSDGQTEPDFPDWAISHWDVMGSQWLLLGGKEYRWAEMVRERTDDVWESGRGRFAQGEEWIPEGFVRYADLDEVPMVNSNDSPGPWSDLKYEGTVYTSDDCPDVIYALITVTQNGEVMWDVDRYVARYVTEAIGQNRILIHNGRRYLLGADAASSVETLPEGAIEIGSVRYVGRDHVPTGELETNREADTCYESYPLDGKTVYAVPGDETVLYIFLEKGKLVMTVILMQE